MKLTSWGCYWLNVIVISSGLPFNVIMDLVGSYHRMNSAYQLCLRLSQMANKWNIPNIIPSTSSFETSIQFFLSSISFVLLISQKYFLNIKKLNVSYSVINSNFRLDFNEHFFFDLLHLQLCSLLYLQVITIQMRIK